MLRTLPQTRAKSDFVRLAGIALFTILTVISAKISIETGNPEVPFTMQVLVVLLSGMVLGARDGAGSQLAYILLIAANAPVDTRGIGAAALFGPTGGFLIGFVVGAFVAGWLVERAGQRFWQRWLAGVAGILVIYLFGASHLLLWTGMDLRTAYQVGVQPFIALDLLKAFIAAGLVETARSWMLPSK